MEFTFVPKRLIKEKEDIVLIHDNVGTPHISRQDDSLRELIERLTGLELYQVRKTANTLTEKEFVLNFTPHLVPMNRGILATCYAKLTDSFSYDDVRSVYEKEYGDEFFIRLKDKGTFPETRWVEGSNFVDIGFTVDDRTGRVVVVGALDNMVKGAAGQAVQNMNLLFSIDEKEGLMIPPVFP